MHPTLYAAHVKGLMKAIHKPLPLSSKEADRLLKTLTSSFRNNLEAAHSPAEDSSGNTRSSLRPRRKSLASSGDVPRHRPIDTPTNQHLWSILSNPLISASPADPAAGNGAAASSSSAVAEGPDPMHVFDRAVSRGMMTPNRALGCLKAKRRELLASSLPSMSQAMAEAGAGSKVLAWFKASGCEQLLYSDSSLGHKLRIELAPFLVAEGLEETIWEWFSHLVALPASSSAPLLLHGLADVKTSDREANLDAAYACLARAHQIVHNHHAGGPPAIVHFYASSWNRICWASTMEAWQHPHKPSVQPFESFAAIGDSIPGKWMPRFSVATAHLALYHPTKPDPSRALSVLTKQSGLWDHISEIGSSEGPDSRFISEVRVMGMDTVQLLTKQGERSEASSLRSHIWQKLCTFLDNRPILSLNDTVQHSPV